jgi:hypothetical protein
MGQLTSTAVQPHLGEDCLGEGDARASRLEDCRALQIFLGELLVHLVLFQVQHSLGRGGVCACVYMFVVCVEVLVGKVVLLQRDGLEDLAGKRLELRARLRAGVLAARRRRSLSPPSREGWHLSLALFCSQNTVQLMAAGVVHVTNLTPGSDNPTLRAIRIPSPAPPATAACAAEVAADATSAAASAADAIAAAAAA